LEPSSRAGLYTAAAVIFIAVAVLVAEGELSREQTDEYAFVAELGLDGALRRVPGTLSLVEAVEGSRVVVAEDAYAEARLGGEREVRCATKLKELVQCLRGEAPFDLPPPAPPTAKAEVTEDLRDVGADHLGHSTLAHAGEDERFEAWPASRGRAWAPGVGDGAHEGGGQAVVGMAALGLASSALGAGAGDIIHSLIISGITLDCKGRSRWTSVDESPPNTLKYSRLQDSMDGNGFQQSASIAEWDTRM